MQITMGAPTNIHSKKEISISGITWRILLSPMMLGGVPMGVARPPIDAAKAFDSNSTAPKPGARRRPPACASSTDNTDTPIGNIIATVAVLLIHILKPAVASIMPPIRAGAVAVSLTIPEALRETFAFEPGQFLTLRADIGGQDVRLDEAI